MEGERRLLLLEDDGLFLPRALSWSGCYVHLYKDKATRRWWWSTNPKSSSDYHMVLSENYPQFPLPPHPVPTRHKAFHLLCEFNALWSRKRRESSSPLKNPIWAPSLPCRTTSIHRWWPGSCWRHFLLCCCSSIFFSLLIKKDDFTWKWTHGCLWASIPEMLRRLRQEKHQIKPQQPT